MEAVAALKRNSPVISNSSRRPMPLPYQTRLIMITAKRGSPGAEKAQVVNKPQTATVADLRIDSGSSTIAPTPPQFSASQVADLMRQIRLVEAQGQSADELKKRLYEAIEQMR